MIKLEFRLKKNNNKSENPLSTESDNFYNYAKF